MNLPIYFSFTLVFAFSGFVFAQPANDNCANAVALTVDNLLCGQTTQNGTIQGGECFTDYGGGASEESVWYRVSATNDSLVFSFTQTNSTNCVSPHVRIFGPFAPGGGCLPACGTAIYNQLHNGDPGVHILRTGLVVGQDYLVQVVNQNCGGGNDRFLNFCLGVFNPAENNTAAGSAGIDECGVSYNGTNIGYYPTNLTPGLENLDGNAGTTCSGCTAGEDVSYVVNNDSWFYFCATTAGTWNVTFNNITNCTNNPLNDGLQMTIFRGTATNLTQVWNSANPSQPGSSQTSPNFSVAAGECIYMVVDGFAGDQCDYSYTLNNVTGGCNLLPLPTTLSVFYGTHLKGTNTLKWRTDSEENSDYFQLEVSNDGENWSELGRINAAGKSNESISYIFEDRNVQDPVLYYRLSQFDLNGTKSWAKSIAVYSNSEMKTVLKTFNTMGQEVDQYYTGLVIIYYTDGSIGRKIQ
jgi:hypothetical protein